MGVFNWFKKKEWKRTEEDKKLEKEMLDIAPKIASRMTVYPNTIKELPTGAKKVILDFMKEEELSLTKEGIINFITIKNSGSEEAFNRVVKMFCDELAQLVKIRINPKDFIKNCNLENVKIKNKFSFPIPVGGLSEKESILFNTAKKNIQLKIKGDKRYKDIDVMGSIKFRISPSNLPRLWKIIDNDERLKTHSLNYPIFLNMQIIFYTSIFDYDRFVNFAKKIDEYLNLQKIDYKEVKRRVIDAVDEIIEKISKDTKMDNKKIKDAFVGLGEQGAIKLVYMRNFTWDIEDFKKKISLLKKMSELMEFMQSTLKSRDFQKDFLASYFEVSTDLDYVPHSGCFATINDKAGIDESIISLPLPDKLKKV